MQTATQLGFAIGQRVIANGKPGIISTWAHDHFGANCTALCITWLRKDGSMGRRFAWLAPSEVKPAPSYLFPRSTVAKTRIVKQDGEYIVQAWDSQGNRLEGADYYTDDKADATQTAAAMIQS